MVPAREGKISSFLEFTRYQGFLTVVVKQRILIQYINSLKMSLSQLKEERAHRCNRSVPV